MSALFNATTIDGTPDLTGQQHVLTRLRHRTVRRRHHEDRAVHLRGTRDHVLDVVGVTRAVDVRVVTVLRLVLHVRDRDRDPTRLLFRRLVDLIERREVFVRVPVGEHLRDRRRQRRLPMVDMTNRPDVQVRLVALELLLGHLTAPNSSARLGWVVDCGSGWLGSGGGTRTRDPTIMSRVLLPTELLRRARRARGPAPASPLTDSNRRPLPYHGSALPTELRGQGPARIAAQRPDRRRRRLVVIWSTCCAPDSPSARDAEAIRDDLQPRGRSSRRSPSTSCPARSTEQVAWIDEHSGGHPAIVAVDDDDAVRRLRLARRRSGPGPPTRRRSRTRSTCTATAGARASASCCSASSSTSPRDHGFHSVIARIVGGHDASIALHRACGFETDRHRARGRPQVRQVARRRR